MAKLALLPSVFTAYPGIDSRIVATLGPQTTKLAPPLKVNL